VEHTGKSQMWWTSYDPPEGVLNHQTWTAKPLPHLWYLSTDTCCNHQSCIFNAKTSHIKNLQ